MYYVSILKESNSSCLSLESLVVTLTFTVRKLSILQWENFIRNHMRLVFHQSFRKVGTHHCAGM